jgi:hypothetical protein
LLETNRFADLFSEESGTAENKLIILRKQAIINGKGF